MSTTAPAPAAAPTPRIGTGAAGRGADFWLPVAAGAAAAVALGPMLWEIGGRLIDTSYYSHAPFYLAALAALAWWRVRDLPAGGRGAGSVRVAAAAWTVALVLAAYSAWIWTPWGGLVAALLAVAAAAYAWGGGEFWGRVAPCWLAAWLIVPPPVGLDGTVVLWLQGVATRWASAGLDVFGFRHLVAGNVVEAPGGNYFVEEACSGVNGLSAVLAAVALYSVWNRRGLVRTLFTLATAAFWVLVANAVRVAGVVLLADRYDLPVLEGAGHEVIGAVTFAGALLLTASTDRLLLFLVPGRKPAAVEDMSELWTKEDAPGPDAPPARPRDLRPLWACVAAGFVAVAGLQIPRLTGAEAAAVAAAAPDRAAALEALKRVPGAALPESWGGWRKVGFDVVKRERSDLMGEYSHVWAYRKGPTTAMVSMDGPFPDGWHDLRICYRGTGWDCSEVADAERLADGRTTALALEKPAGRRGLVLFSAHTLAGDEPVEPGGPATVGGAFAGRLGLADLFADAAASPPAYQVQVLTEAHRPIGDRERAEVAALLDEMRDRLTAWTPPAGAPPAG